MNWRIMTGIGLIFPIALFILALVAMKEPRPGLRLADEESTALRSPDANDLRIPEQTGFAGLFQRKSISYIFLGIVLSATLQLTGINAVMNFAPDIFKAAGVSDEYLANAGVGAWNFLTTFVAAILVERLGRRKLMIGGTVVLTIALIFTGIAFFFFTGITQSLLVGAGIALYLVGFEGGPGCLFWVLINELFPENIRGAANSFCNIVQWGFNLIISTTFPILLGVIGKEKAYILFWVYGGIGIVCGALLIITQKETRRATFNAPDYE